MLAPLRDDIDEGFAHTMQISLRRVALCVPDQFMDPNELRKGPAVWLIGELCGEFSGSEGAEPKMGVFCFKFLDESNVGLCDSLASVDSPSGGHGEPVCELVCLLDRHHRRYFPRADLLHPYRYWG